MISCFRQAKSIQSFIFREKKKKNLEKIFSKFISVEYLKVMKFEDTNYNQLLKYKFDCSKNIYCLFSLYRKSNYRRDSVHGSNCNRHNKNYAIKTQCFENVLAKSSTMVYGCNAYYCIILSRTRTEPNTSNDTTSYIFLLCCII